MKKFGKDSGKAVSIRRYVAILISAWTILILASLAWNTHHGGREALSMASIQARADIQRDIIYRRWNAEHGGVYVPVSEKTPPNPYLHVPNRDFTDPSGRLLTLVNPAYMTRQVFELAEEAYGLHGHITSLNPIRAQNYPDPWETQSLKAFEQGTEESSTIEKIAGQPYLRLMKPLFVEEPCLKCHAEQGYKTGEVRGGISVAVPLTPIWAVQRSRMIASVGGHGLIWLIGMLGIAIGASRLQNQISKREQAEKELEESLSLLSATLDSTADGILVVDQDGKIISFNRRFVDMWGIPESIIESRDDNKALEFVLSQLSNSEEFLRKVRELYSQPIAESFDVLEFKDGRTFERYSQPQIVKGKSVGRAWSFRDVTDRKKAETSLRSEHNRLQSLMDGLAGAGIGIDVVGHDYGILYQNMALRERFGDPCGKLCYEEYLGREKPCDFCPAMKAIENGRIERAELIGVDGRQYEVLSSPFRNPDGTVDKAIEIVQDITERKQSEEEKRKLESQLQHAQKLESLGVLAGGIAHDFNNLLTVILGNAGLAFMKLSSASPARDNIREIEEASQRAAELCSRMLAYSGKGRFVIEAINLTEVVREMMHLLNISISKKAALKFDLADTLPAIEVDVAQIRQVIMSLVTNASEAISEKSGVISIATGALECDRRCLSEMFLGEQLNEGLYVYLEVSDSGCGIRKEDITKIFDPFYTTKFSGRGLGLAAALGIVRGHKGAIKIRSEVGEGTTFNVLFPTLDKPAKPCEAKKATYEDWRGNGTVLLVDDQESVRRIAKEMLEAAGFTVILAGDGREAVEMFQKHKDEIILVLLDMTMPRMSGEEAFLEIRRIKNDARVILCSGYNEQEVTNRFAGKELTGFVQKPYRYENLIGTVKKALAG